MQGCNNLDFVSNKLDFISCADRDSFVNPVTYYILINNPVASVFSSLMPHPNIFPCKFKYVLKNSVFLWKMSFVLLLFHALTHIAIYIAKSIASYISTAKIIPYNVKNLVNILS